jgi:hypothetical protein
MQLRLWWWRKVRGANIPTEDRDVFERFGETVITLFLTSGFQPHAAELQAMYNRKEKIESATRWLTERSDTLEQREQRLETAEWAILIFVVIGVILDLCLLAHR